MTASSNDSSQARFKNFYLLFLSVGGKSTQGERDFEQISKTIRKEVGRFEASIIILHFS